MRTKRVVFIIVLGMFCILTACFGNEKSVLDISQLSNQAFHEDGSFTALGVIQVLRREELLPDSLFESDKVTPQKNVIRVDESKLKTYGKIYRVSVNLDQVKGIQPSKSNHFAQIFVIKYFIESEEKELKNLSEVANSAIAKLPLEDRDFPIFCLDEKNYFYTYPDAQGGKEHSFVVLHSAKGRMIEEFFQDVLSLQDKIKQKDQNALKVFDQAKRAFFRTGQVAAKLHLRFALNPRQFSSMNTAIHGDYHSENIFYNIENDRIYLIDNEYIAVSINEPQYFGEDIHAFIEYLSERETPDNDRLLLELYSIFRDGYLSKVPAAQQIEAREKLNQLIAEARKKR